MSKKTPYLIDVGLGLVITGLVVFGYTKKSTFSETASLKTYDLFSKFRKPNANTDAVRIVEIDENAVAQFGRWPWPRALQAQLVDDVVSGGAKVIGLNMLYSEADQNSGLEEIAQLETRYKELLAAQGPNLRRKKVNLAPFQEFLDDDLANAKSNLDGDSVLAQSVEQAVNVVLPMYFQMGEPLGNLDPLPDYFAKEKAKLPKEALDKFPQSNAASLPLDTFGKAALGIGQSNLEVDKDGTLRRIAPVVRYGEAAYPSFALEIVREYLKLQRDALTWKAGEGLALSKAKIPVDEDSMTYLEFAGPAGTFKRHSAVDVLSGGIPEKSLKDKIVLIGLTAPGLADAFVTPSGERLTGLEIWATHIENILNQHFITRPPWAVKAEWGMIALGALIALLVLPLLRARVAVWLAAIAFFGCLGASYFLFSKQGFWVSPAYGLLLIGGGFAFIVGRRLIFTEKGKELVEAEGVETNKMLGLSFQGQGMLDLAFEKFRRCPIDDAMKDLLYNLGLDMERKRQFAKAAAVYEHIATDDASYKDIKEKIELLKKAGEGAVFGGIGKKGSDATVVVEGLGQHTTLGRYEVVKELGRGAMGIVYLGKDPKINRQVAIKTLRFEEDMDENQTKSIKDRFFREAESAGNLTHPNIIRIFDAGEDQDVAYIAMELLEGHDLKVHCDKSNLLPMERVIEMVTQVAFGLDYAHKQGVVHRDIKPANIMLLKDDTLRITDFGIARIQTSSKTATGAVLGTPAYMSPEQVNGSKKVDGRADIFSLGVTLFELLTGEKPFAADSIAALLYRIANVEHADPREFNPKLPVGLIPIINKALAKDPANRYQTAEEMGNDLKAFAQNPDAANKAAAAIIKEAKANAAPEATLPVTEPTPEAVKKMKASVPEPEPVQPTNFNDISKDAFLSELEQAFQIPPNSPPVKQEEAIPPILQADPFGEPDQTSTLNTSELIPKGTPAGHDTVVIPPNDAIEKTVVMEPNSKGKDAPLAPGIEHNFQPPIPGTVSDQDDKKRKAL